MQATTQPIQEMQSTHQIQSKEYEDFKDLVVEAVASRIEGRVALQVITKNNGLKLDGLTIMTENTNISPTIYLNYYFEEYIKHGLEAVVDKIMEQYEQNKSEAPIDLSFFTEVEKVRNKIKMKLVNYEKNEELLEKVPHIKYLDLAIIFYVEVENKQNEGLATIQIYNHHLSFWDLREEELFELAKKNMENDFVIESIFRTLFDDADDNFRSMVQVVESYFKMHIVTNKVHMYGAIGILQSELLNEFMERNESEKLIIIPSSVHEALLIPCDEETELPALNEMIREVNDMQLLPEEILSYSAYIYDGETIEMVA